MELVVGKVVLHKAFGRGIISSADARYFTVDFENKAIGEKTFIFPDAFRNLISFEDTQLQSGAEVAASEAAQTMQGYSQQIRERCIREAVAQGKSTKNAKTRKTTTTKRKA